MAKFTLSPPPEIFRRDRYLLTWINRVIERISDIDAIEWAQIDKTGSDIADLEIRNFSDITTRTHSLLEGILPVDVTSSDTDRDKHVSDSDIKASTDNISTTNAHIVATTAHGSTGKIIGVEDTATTAIAGVVLKATSSPDSTDTVTSADATDLATVITLANELKADHNALLADYNVLKSLLRTSGVLS